jgi:DNA-binding transcriptional MerR regulator
MPPNRKFCETHPCPPTACRQEVLLDSRTGSRLHTETVNAAKTILRSGELARITGVSVDTIRHYERLGILPKAQRTASGYRLYAPDAVGRVQLARRSIQLGFSLRELAEILQTRDNGGAPCHRVLALAEGKLSSLGQQIDELRRSQTYMRRLVRDWRRKLRHTPQGNKAMLLHSLTDRAKSTYGSNNLKRRSQ